MTTYIRQDSQVRNSDIYDDTLSMAGAETGAESIEDDLNYIRSQLKILSGKDNWYDALDDNFDLTAVRNKRFLYWVQKTDDVTVPSSQNYVVLSGADRPSDVIAYGPTSLGAATAQLGGAVGSHSTSVSSNNGNLLQIRDADTNDPILTTGGEMIWGLLQVGSAATDGNAFADAGDDRGQISFVYIDPTTEALTAVDIVDVENKVIEYAYKKRVDFFNLPEWAFNQGTPGGGGGGGSVGSLDDLTDVGVTGETGADALMYNAATNKFENRQITTEDVQYSLTHSHINKTQDVINHMWSPGACADGFALTDNGDGTINIASGSAVLRSTNSAHGELNGYAMSGVTNLAMTDEATNYVLVDYNGGATGVPGITVSTDLNAVITDRRSTIIYVVNRLGNNLHIADMRARNVDFMTKNMIKDYLVFRIQYANGSEVADAASLQFSISAGTYFALNNQFTIPAFSAGDPFEYIYGDTLNGWTRGGTATAINNLQYYNTGTMALAAIPNNKFGIHFIYGVINIPGHYTVVYGTSSYDTLADAQIAPIPTDLPSDLDYYSTAVLVAKIITQQNVNTQFSDIQIPKRDILVSGVANTHNNLAGLQGGTAGEYFHLTSAQHANILDGADYFQISTGRNAVATNVYLRGPDGVPTNLSGFVVPFDATIVRITASTQNAHSWTAEVRKNGSVAVIASLAISAATTGISTLLSVDVSAGDIIQTYCNGTAITYPLVMVYLKRR